MNKGIRIFEEDGRRVVEGLGYYKLKQIGDLRELVKKVPVCTAPLLALSLKIIMDI